MREITKFILQNRALLHSVSRKVGSLLHCCCCCIVGCFAVVMMMMMIREKRRRFSTCYPRVSHNGSLSRPKPTSHSPKGGEGEVSLLLPPLSCGQFLEGRSLVSRMECGFSWHLFFEFLMREFRLSNLGSPKIKEREGIMWEIPTRVSQRSSFEGRFTIS